MDTNQERSISFTVYMQTLSEDEFIQLSDDFRMSKSLQQLKDLIKTSGSFQSNLDQKEYAGNKASKFKAKGKGALTYGTS